MLVFCFNGFDYSRTRITEARLPIAATISHLL